MHRVVFDDYWGEGVSSLVLLQSKMPEMCVLGSVRSPCKQQELPEIIDAHSLHGYLRAFLKARPVSGSLW